jgi:hypothetical protein
MKKADDSIKKMIRVRLKDYSKKELEEILKLLKSKRQKKKD